jgi:hypothetical protein
LVFDFWFLSFDFEAFGLKTKSEDRNRFSNPKSKINCVIIYNFL